MLEHDAIAAMEAIKAKTTAEAREREIAAAIAADKTAATEADTTVAGNISKVGPSSAKPGAQVKKKPGKVKLSAKEKKERSVRSIHPQLVIN